MTGVQTCALPILLVVRQIYCPLIGHHLSVLVRESAHRELLFEGRRRRIRVLYLDYPTVVVWIGVVAQVIGQFLLV